MLPTNTISTSFMPPRPTYTSELHILAEQGEWDQLASRLEQCLQRRAQQEANDDAMLKRSSTRDMATTTTSKGNDYYVDDDNDDLGDEDNLGIRVSASRIISSTDHNPDRNNPIISTAPAATSTMDDNINDISPMSSPSTTESDKDSIIKQLQTGEGPHSWTPLMLSCNRAPPHIIELILKCSPESANICDRTGTYPLHFVLWWNDDDSESSTGSQYRDDDDDDDDGQNDDDVNDDDDDDDDDQNDYHDDERIHIPQDQQLNIPAAKAAPTAFVTSPESTTHQQKQQHHHQTINKDVNERNLHKVLRMLVRVNPKVLSYQNQWGMTPLHSVFDRENLSSVETLKILLGLLNNPSNSNIKDGSCSTDILNNNDGDGDNKDNDDDDANIHTYALLALTKPDNNFHLPLHLAASRGANEEILRILVSLYPESATITTAEGDLPIHLLQYWAEDEAKHFNLGGNTSGSSNSPLNNFWYDSGIFRISKNNLFNCITVGQVEALLEPMCYGPNTSRQWSSIADIKSQSNIKRVRNDHHQHENEQQHQINIQEFKQNTINFASRQPGSRDFLPIHIAADHGVSYEILSALCEKYPEGVATPRPTNYSSYSGSKMSLLSTGGGGGDESSSLKRWPQEMYPIEIFETGRAGLYVEKALQTQQQQQQQQQQQDSNNPGSQLHTTNASPTATNMERAITSALNSFEKRSDLLFAYYPDAVPWRYREEKNTKKKRPSANLDRRSDFHVSNRQRSKASAELYRNDLNRIKRLERRIRSEACEGDIRELSMTAKLVWRWIYQGVHSSEGGMRGNHQGSIGRIITNLPDRALLKLSYHIHTFKDAGSVSEDDDQSLRLKPCLIQGTSILDMAKNREATISMQEMLSFSNSKDRYNWQSIVCEYLTGEEGLQYNAFLKKTNGAGLRYLAESKLSETGRTWHFNSSDDDTIDSDVSEFWQHLNSALVIPEGTHTVLIKYYLEVSVSGQSSTFGGVSQPLPLDQIKGGLVVVSEKNSSNEKDTRSGEFIVATQQRKLMNSKLKTRSGYEVSLSFRFNAGYTYSLRARGPSKGGRVSVSNTRIQQIIYSVDRYNRTPLHVLLSSKIFTSLLPVSTQVKMILKGRSDSLDRVSLHLAIKFGASIEVLNALIAINPSSLLKKNEQGCTPLHYVFLISEEIRPSLGVVKCLLTTPGENATRLKDSADRLPLHIAAERAADAAILELLIEANADGCYRKNRDGDLPIHLLVRSGKATQATVEMLLLPIIDSETICGIPGSRGLELPLHIAAEYNCSFKVLERLLISYSKAATIPRRRVGEKASHSSQMYAIDIFEGNRAAFTSKLKAQKSRSYRSFSRSHSGFSQASIATEEAVRIDMAIADFDLRSDLIFVFFPNAPSTASNNNLYRKDIHRIKRLQNLIRKEANSCAEYLTVNDEAAMSEMAQLAWCFFCTFENPGDINDEYSTIVGQILKGLPNPVVQILSNIRNPYSSPNPHMTILECATTKCKRLISSRLLFVGRFTLDANDGVLHKSEDCLILNAFDHFMEESYRRFVSTFKKEEEVKDIDDVASCHSGNIGHMLSFGDDAQSLFVDFAVKLGFDEDEANNKYEELVSKRDVARPSNLTEFQTKAERKEMALETFRQFCDTHRVDTSGVGRVVIKFMKNRSRFLREKVVRARLSLSKENCCILPIIEDYDVDRVQHSSASLDTSADSPDVHGSIVFGHKFWTFESKDSIYAMDVIENNVLGYDLSAYKYSLVLPSGDRNLEAMLSHENLDSVNTRDVLQSIGRALKELHDNGVVHGNITASNVVRIGSRIGLVDFDSASLIEDGKGDTSILSSNFGGMSQKSSSGILPPEMITRIDLSKNNQVLQRVQKYWSDVINDSFDFSLLNSDDVHTITSVIQGFLDEDNALKRAHGVLGALANKLSHTSDAMSEISWREKLSESLHEISFVDLPNTLAECQNIHDFHDVWNRLKTNFALWERIRPRIDDGKQYAYFVKYYDDSGTRAKNEHDDLPYDLVQSNYSIDVWEFGMLMFQMCSRTTLFHTTIDGNLLDDRSYQQLYDWNSDIAKQKISSHINDPIAQDLLMKILVPAQERVSSLDEVLQHPYFGPSSSIEARQILEDHAERQLKMMDLNPRKELETHDIEKIRFLSLEKYCKIIFDKLDSIPHPTNLIVLPYKLVLNKVREELEIPRDHKSLTKGELVGNQLIKFNTIIAKLSFWLKVKENLCQKGRGEFKTKILAWIKRARTEGSYVIASEIVGAVGCDVRYQGICVEMLDEEMSITNARAFIRDPMKAAAMLTETTLNTLLSCYHAQHMYLIDEFHGSPTLSFDQEGKIQDEIYPIALGSSGSNDFKDVLFPFMMISMLSATSVDGLRGLSKLLGFPPSHSIPKAWVDSNVGVIPLQNHSKSLPSTVVPFATLHNILRQNQRELALRQTGKYSIRLPEGSFDPNNIMVETDLSKLQAFFQKHDPSKSYANLNRICDEQDSSLVSWTHEGMLKTQLKQQQKEEFAQALRRLEEVQKEIEGKKKLEDEVLVLTDRIAEMNMKTDARALRRSRRASLVKQSIRMMQSQPNPQVLQSMGPSLPNMSQMNINASQGIQMMQQSGTSILQDQLPLYNSTHGLTSRWSSADQTQHPRWNTASILTSQSGVPQHHQHSIQGTRSSLEASVQLQTPSGGPTPFNTPSIPDNAGRANRRRGGSTAMTGRDDRDGGKDDGETKKDKSVYFI